jgi:hypothetical protein
MSLFKSKQRVAGQPPRQPWMIRETIDALMRLRGHRVSIPDRIRRGLPRQEVVVGS